MTSLDDLPEELRNQVIASRKAFQLATELHNDLLQYFPIVDLNISVSGTSAVVRGAIADLSLNDEIMQYLINSGKIAELDVEFTLIEKA